MLLLPADSTILVCTRAPLYPYLSTTVRFNMAHCEPIHLAILNVRVFYISPRLILLLILLH